MDKEEMRGTRASTWLKVQRCLVVLRRLQHGPASRRELIGAVRVALGESAYADAPEKALGRDIQQLRDTFDVAIQSRKGAYHLIQTGTLPLLDLPEEALGAMAFLYNTFQPDAPGAGDVRGLLDILMEYLPEERREVVRRMRAVPQLDLLPVDGADIDEETWKRVEQAVVKGRQLTFDYHSPHRQVPTRHVVAPYELDFQDGHFYLEADCLHWKGPEGESRRGARIPYRVDRIVPGSARVLPDKLPPGRPSPRAYTLRYELSPAIVRGGVSRRFPETQVKIREDGWAVVTARITSPFMAAKTLLRYGENCRVLGPPEVVRLVEEAVRGMAEMYGVCGRQEESRG